MLGALSSLNIRHDMVYRFIAHDGIAYESIDAVIKAAIADGFDYFDGYRWMTDQRRIAWCWSWASVMRYVIQLDQTVMFLLDDQIPIPGWTYERLCYLIDEADNYNQMKMIQLNADTTVNSESAVTSMLGKGISFKGGTDFGLILRPAGAEMLLDAQRIPVKDGAPPHDFPFKDLDRIYRQQFHFDCVTGVYHTIAPVVQPSNYPFSSDLRD